MRPVDKGALTSTNLLDQISVDVDTALIVDRRQQQLNALGGACISFEHADEVTQWTTFDSHFVAQRDVVAGFNKILRLHLQANQLNDLIGNDYRVAAEADDLVDATGEPHFMKHCGGVEAGKDVTGK